MKQKLLVASLIAVMVLAVAGVALAKPGGVADGRKVHRQGLHVIHSDGVAQRSGGGFVTVRQQRGEITQISSSSMRVKSADGFTSTYVIDKDTKIRVKGRSGADAPLDALKVGDKVGVHAVKNDSGFLAKAVVSGRAPGHQGPRLRRPRNPTGNSESGSI